MLQFSCKYPLQAHIFRHLVSIWWCCWEVVEAFRHWSLTWKYRDAEVGLRVVSGLCFQLELCASLQLRFEEHAMLQAYTTMMESLLQCLIHPPPWMESLLQCLIYTPSGWSPRYNVLSTHHHVWSPCHNVLYTHHHGLYLSICGLWAKINSFLT